MEGETLGDDEELLLFLLLFLGCIVWLRFFISYRFVIMDFNGCCCCCWIWFGNLLIVPAVADVRQAE